MVHIAFRNNSLISVDMSTLLFYPPAVYSFRNIDLVYDFLLSIGMKPYVELRYDCRMQPFTDSVHCSFMPNALASGNSTVFHYEGVYFSFFFSLNCNQQTLPRLRIIPIGPIL